MRRSFVKIDNVVGYLSQQRLVAVIRSESADDAVCKALKAIASGVKVIEVAWTTPNAGRAIETLRDRVPLLGAGTVVTSEDAQKAIGSGAQFLVAPNFSRDVAHIALHRSISYIPGVLTPGDVIQATTEGFNVLKLFPASTGGVRHMRALQEPFPKVQWIPTGGVTWDSAHEWLESGALAVGMGTSLFATQDLPRALAALGETPL